jgi:hypothetical protein
MHWTSRTEPIVARVVRPKPEMAAALSRQRSTIAARVLFAWVHAKSRPSITCDMSRKIFRVFADTPQK